MSKKVYHLMPYTINDSLIKISIENDFIKYYWKNDGEIWFFRCETPLSLTGKLKYVKKLVNRKSLITNQNIYDQCTVNAGTQWVAGEQCSVYKTVDDGKTWISQNSNNYQPLDNLSSVYFIDKCHGYITGQNGTLLTTENGGNSWSFAIKPINASNNFKQVVFSDRQNGYILFTPEESYIGNSNRILRTSDSGRSWNICSYNNSDGDTNGVTIKGKMKLLCFLNRNWMNDSLYSALPNLIQFDEKFNGQIRSNNLYWVHDLYSFSTDTFWCVGYAEIFKTYDGGKTIEKILSVDHYYEVNYCFNSITFTSPSTGWVVGSGGLILKSTDSGQTWQQQTSPTNGEIKKIRFVNPAFGWMFNNKLSDGKGNIFITSDSGKTWKDYSVAGFQLNDVFCPDTENCWAVGNDGLIMRLCNTENRKISIVYPKKKNEFKAGDTLTVKWTSPGVSKVSIAISYDNGASYTTYRAVTEDDGDETIQISANPVLSDKCILRIRSADGTVQGTSETFSITANDVAVNDLNLPAIQKENIKVVNSVLYYTLSRNVLAHAALYSISGREIFRKKLSTESCGRKMEKLPLDKLEKGCYLMRITAGENVFSDKIIIHR